MARMVRGPLLERVPVHAPQHRGQFDAAFGGGLVGGRGGVVVDLVAGFGAGDGGAASAKHRVASAWAFAFVDFDPNIGIKGTLVELAVQEPIFVAREPVAERVHMPRRPAKHGEGGGVDLGDLWCSNSRYVRGLSAALWRRSPRSRWQCGCRTDPGGGARQHSGARRPGSQ